MKKSRAKKTIEIAWTVSPQQAEFIADTEHRHLGYGGARGGGKSWAIRAKAIKMCLQYKGYRVLIIRRTYPELQENHIKPMKEMLNGIAKYNGSEKQFTFKNGSVIKFGHCDTERAMERYQGQEWDMIEFDEATKILEEWLMRIKACNRGANDYPKQCVYTANPGGVSHAYFKRIFITKKYQGRENPADYHFIQARVTDNAKLLEKDPEYLQMLLALPPKLREAWLYGSWDIMEGQYFDEFRDDPSGYKTRQWTHVIPAEGFKIPPSWPIYRSFDWGHFRPYSCGWWTTDYDGTLYRIAELYGCKRVNGESQPNEGVKETPDIVFERIARMEREHPLLAGRKITYGVADPAIWDAQYGPSVADVAAKAGVYFIKGDHKRIPGWLQCHWRMQFDADGYPRLYVLDTCRDFIRTIQMLCHDERNPEDVDSRQEDHCADEFRYLAMSMPVEARKQEEQYNPMYGSDPLDQYKKARRA